MKILVCVKQVLDGECPAEIDETGRWLRPLFEPVYRMNRYDEYALEEALRIREDHPGVTVDAVSAGPQRAAAVVRRALEMGAGEGIHIVLPGEAYRSPFAIATLLAAYARDRGYDLILAGVMAEDDMQAQVGPMLAALLDYPWATAVIRRELRPAEGVISVEREIEGGAREAVELTLPAVLTIQSGINRPRYPALSHVLRARSQALLTIPAADLAPAEAREVLEQFGRPQGSRDGVILSGTPQEKARRMLEILREKALL